MKILINSAWPYANGPLHIGHIAALLPADILARYHREKGDDVYLVSGSDCHGTPVTIRAKQENRSPEEISNAYHNEFCECFSTLGFSFDHYGKTSSREHTDFVQDFHAQMYKGDHIYEQETPQAFCETCNTALSDRFVIGRCPACGTQARGDQCDACGLVLEPESLIEPQCAMCGATPVFHLSKHLFLRVSDFTDELATLVDHHPNWRHNAIQFTHRYISEGLRDRAVTRDLTWGIDVPKTGYEHKKIYIWAENVLGYLSMSKAACEERGTSFEELWNGNAHHYYVHGKDNIPFHTIILPALLLAHGGAWRLPDEIVSSEYLTLEGQKISTSRNWAIWAKDIAARYNPDSIRYFLTTNGPEKRDTDFSWREFVNSHNGELLGAYGNLVNRTLAFCYKYFDCAVPAGRIDEKIERRIKSLYIETGALIEKGRIKEALDEVFRFVREMNKYFDSWKPWETRKTDPAACQAVIFTCIEAIANLAELLCPFLPFSSEKVKAALNIEDGWWRKRAKAGQTLSEPEILFQRIDKSVIDKELKKLQALTV